MKTTWNSLWISFVSISLITACGFGTGIDHRHLSKDTQGDALKTREIPGGSVCLASKDPLDVFALKGDCGGGGGMALAPLPPGKLEIIPAAGNGDRALHLSWQFNSPETQIEFWIFRSSDPAFSDLTQVGSTEASSFIEENLSPSDYYFYQVRAYSTRTGEISGPNNTCLVGETVTSPPCGWSTEDPPAGAPNPPGSLEAVVIHSERIDLSWTAASGADEYVIERSGNGIVFVPLGDPLPSAVLFWTDTEDLETWHDYTYRVYARNSAGGSDHSNTVVVNTGGTPSGAPAAPSNLGATVINASQINLTWEDNAYNEMNFELERKINDGIDDFSLLQILPANRLTWPDTNGIASETSYVYRIKATNAAGDSAYAVSASVTTPVVMPAAPSNLHLVSVTDADATLAWDDNSDNEDLFLLQRWIGSGFVTVRELAPNVTTAVDTGLEPLTDYSYRVAAVNEGGSRFSGHIVITTDYPDADGDGFRADVDCDDNNPNIYPGAPDNWENGVDLNCVPDRTVCGAYVPYGMGGFEYNTRIELNSETYEPYNLYAWGVLWNGICGGPWYNLTGTWQCSSWPTQGVRVEKLSDIRFRLRSRVVNSAGQTVNRTCEVGD